MIQAMLLAAAAAPMTAEDVAEAGRYYLEARPALAQEDCVGLVEAVTALAGHPVGGNIRDLWAAAVAEGRTHDAPHVGDVAFFDDTFDRNRDGRPNDPFTHVAVVVRIEADGTVVMVHRGGPAGIRELRMNLARPGVRRDGDVVLNDYLAQVGWANARGERFASQLLRGFASYADAPPLATVVAVARLRRREVAAMACEEVTDRCSEVAVRFGLEPGLAVCRPDDVGTLPRADRRELRLLRTAPACR